MAPSTWWSRSRRADVTARVQTPTAGLARSRGASPARPCRPPILRVLPDRRARRAGTGQDLASYDIFCVFYLSLARKKLSRWNRGETRRRAPAGQRAIACAEVGSRLPGRHDTAERALLRRPPVPAGGHQPRRLALLPFPAEPAHG